MKSKKDEPEVLNLSEESVADFRKAIENVGKNTGVSNSSITVKDDGTIIIEPTKAIYLLNLGKEYEKILAAAKDKPNGLESWIETFYEIVDHLATTSNPDASMANKVRERGGRTAQYVLAGELTDEFEKRYPVRYWDGHDYFETIDAFLAEKEAAYR
jgi:hypothetical protein